MDKTKLTFWKYITYMRLQYMNSYYFPLELFFVKGVKPDLQLFQKSLQAKNKGLYIHVPFCITECSYCACTKQALQKKDETKKYVSYLIQELKMFYDLNAGKKLVFNTLTFGGGTPSVFSPDEIRELFTGIYRYIQKDFLEQISFEAAPYTMTDEKIDALKEGGVGRMSFGIQSLDKDVLAQNNRPYIDKKRIQHLIEYLHQSDILIEADLIVGIRGQSVRTLIEDVKFLLSTGVDDITFNYFSPHRYSKYSDTKESVALKERFKAIEKKLVENGQIRGSYCFQERYIYSARRYSIIGLGYGATSNLGNSFVYVKDSLEEYYDLIDRGVLPVSSGIYMNDDFEYIRYIYWHLIQGTLDLGKMDEIFGCDVRQKFKNQFQFLIDEGVIRIENKKVIQTSHIDTLFVYLTVFLEDIIGESVHNTLPETLPKNMDVILKQMIHDYVV